MTFIAKAKNGGMDFGSDYNTARFKQWLKDNEGKELRIQPLTRKRTLNQNDFYWFYLEIIERETGNNANDLHEYFKRLLLPPKFVQVMNKTIKLPKSTTELNKVEFSDYMDKICAEVEIPIPDVESYKKYKDGAPMLNEN